MSDRLNAALKREPIGKPPAQAAIRRKAKPVSKKPRKPLEKPTKKPTKRKPTSKKPSASGVAKASGVSRAAARPAKPKKKSA